ncbi:Flp pilus assembly protein CpaB (plasmid) [Pseudarthrobacter sp. P1]|uniref:Flp pilus assembly protein CpaB n=1 Tax=Pseudarthrobacter sp. P1 TaxID=3418418 RepID=UPI003CE8A1E9
MKTRLLGGVAALVLAIVGIVLLSTYVQAADSRAQAGMNPVDVLVVQQPVPVGTTIDKLKELVKTQSFPQAAVPAGAVKDLSKFTGKVAGVALVPGEQLMESRLVDPTALTTPNQVPVPKGLEEVTLKLDPERVIGGQLQAGDTVGIFISYNTGVAPGSQDNPATKLQFRKVLVTRVDGGAATPSSGSDQNGQKSGSTTLVLVTVAQSGADATHTIHGMEFGKIYLSKENADTPTDSTDTLHKDGVLK